MSHLLVAEPLRYRGGLAF